MYSEVLGAGLVPPWRPEGQGKYSGKPILIMGGSSSVGSYGKGKNVYKGVSHYTIVIQLARLSGFSPIITTASRSHKDYLKSLGATNVVHRHVDKEEQKMAITEINSSPIELVYDAISLPETQEVAFNILAPGGTLVSTLKPVVEENQGKSRRVVATYGSPHVEVNHALCQEAWSVLESWLHDGVLKVRVLICRIGVTLTTARAAK